MLSEGMKNKHIWICVSTKNFTQQNQKSKKLESESFFLEIVNPYPLPIHLQSYIHILFIKMPFY